MIPEDDVLLYVVECNVKLESTTPGGVVHAPILRKIEDVAYLYLTTECLVLSGAWGTKGYPILSEVHVLAVEDARRCRLDLDGDVVSFQGAHSLDTVCYYITTLHDDPKVASRFASGFVNNPAPQQTEPSGWAMAVRRGYIGLGLGALGIIGAIPTNNTSGYVLGSAALVFGGLAWLRMRSTR